MKKNLLLLLGVILLANCKKTSPISTKSETDNLLTHKVSYSYRDTVTKSSPKNTLTVNGASPYFTVRPSYIGNNYYTLTTTITNNSDLVIHPAYTLYKDGVAYHSEELTYYGGFTVSLSLPPGTYYFIITGDKVPVQTASLQSQNFVIAAKPVAPNGMICLYEYYNSKNGQHVCTYDWEELGSATNDYNFIKVLGYTYPSLSSAPNLKAIYRYYNAGTGSHYTTDVLGSYPGFVYEKILGYVGISPSTDLPRSLTRYYNHFLDDHFVCVAPEVPLAPDYTPDPIFTFGYLQ